MEYSSAEDSFFNYCLWEYRPLAPPSGKFKAANLLHHSFDVGSAHENAFRIVQLISVYLVVLILVLGMIFD